jgi:hypothetical protein
MTLSNLLLSPELLTHVQSALTNYSSTKRSCLTQAYTATKRANTSTLAAEANRKTSLLASKINLSAIICGFRRLSPAHSSFPCWRR